MSTNRMSVLEAEALLVERREAEERHARAEALALQARELRRRAEDAANDHGQAAGQLADAEQAAGALVAVRDVVRKLSPAVQAGLGRGAGRSVYGVEDVPFAAIIETAANNASDQVQKLRQRVAELREKHGRRVEELEAFVGAKASKK